MMVLTVVLLYKVCKKIYRWTLMEQVQWRERDHQELRKNGPVTKLAYFFWPGFNAASGLLFLLFGFLSSHITILVMYCT
jgi:hypothetical protein